MVLMSEPDFFQCDPGKLAEEAEQLQTRMNEFIGRCTMADVRLPGALYDANAELLCVPGQLRDIARRTAEASRRASRAPAFGRRVRHALQVVSHRW